jgi:glycerate 2-kinase
MKILIAPDSFKECLDAKLVADYIEEGIISANNINSKLKITKLPLCDGGEGFLERIISRSNGRYIQCSAVDPLGKEIIVESGLINNKTVIIESAKTCGISLIEEGLRDPKITSSYGLGMVFKDAVSRGYEDIVIGFGGSVTNDGGAGVLQALGISLQDENYSEIPFGGAALSELAHVDRSSMIQIKPELNVTLVCNPSSILCGENSTSKIYATQKGASFSDIKILDKALNNYAEKILNFTGRDIRYIPGSGGAGGVASAFMAFFSYKQIASMDYIQSYLNLEKNIKESDLIITGEGKLDIQTSSGKVVDRICLLAKKYNKPVIVITGQATPRATDMYPQGMSSYFCIGRCPRSINRAIKEARSDIIDSSRRMMELLSIGGGIKYVS